MADCGMIDAFRLTGSIPKPTPDGVRVDAALSALLPPLSRTYFGSIAVDGLVQLNGEPRLGVEMATNRLSPLLAIATPPLPLL
eukprot:scaffold10598_cov138-Isochrysis_galbana.AAC.4